ncbi:MAG TPA: lysylphosphatidylglycerol synthase domain-containing protein [Candidatus Saccharimonadales bacterium]|nr:lysylphosphatidylglycerol synthase domain-containing protein [Candidatus Saccharimonadales bacterium]
MFSKKIRIKTVTSLIKRYQRFIAVSVLVVTALLIARFVFLHRNYFSELLRINPYIILLLIFMYSIMLVVWTLQYDLLIRLCGKRIPKSENFLLTCYSSVINFFGPLQSGPGVRAVYLKNIHQIRMRDYFKVTLWYYGLFALISGVFLVFGNRNIWLMIFVLVITIGIATIVHHRFATKSFPYHKSRSTLFFILLAFAVLAQVWLTSIIYFTELHVTNHAIHYSQAVSYTGAGNFAMFVSLTPGAIGFREAFLIASTHIHKIAITNIIAASVIDRGIYCVLLAGVFLVTFVFKTQQRFKTNRSLGAKKKVIES